MLLVIAPTSVRYFVNLTFLFLLRTTRSLPPRIYLPVSLSLLFFFVVVFGGLAILPAHMVLGLSWFTPILSIVIIGLSFSLVPAALWPSIPRIVAEENIATAYGMMVRTKWGDGFFFKCVVGFFSLIHNTARRPPFKTLA